MHAPDVKRTWQRGGMIGLALLSLAVPIAAILLNRQTVSILILGMACAVGAVAGARWLTPTWVRRLSIVLATLGLLISAYVLWVQIGLCGTGVLWGTCRA